MRCLSCADHLVGKNRLDRWLHSRRLWLYGNCISGSRRNGLRDDRDDRRSFEVGCPRNDGIVGCRNDRCTRGGGVYEMRWNYSRLCGLGCGYCNGRPHRLRHLWNDGSLRRQLLAAGRRRRDDRDLNCTRKLSPSWIASGHAEKPWWDAKIRSTQPSLALRNPIAKQELTTG